VRAGGIADIRVVASFWLFLCPSGGRIGMQPDLWQFEKQAACSGHDLVAGVDEAGRGPLAGPVVAAAVVLPSDFPGQGIDDSKKLSERRRLNAFRIIRRQALTVGLGIVNAARIDTINILQAARLAMARAVCRLDPQPSLLLIDGNFTIDLPVAQQPLIKGDSRSISIACASIVAKVTRDRIMRACHRRFPQYGFDRHKGYPTAAHKQALACHGPCPLHRKTFRGVRELLETGPPC